MDLGERLMRTARRIGFSIFILTAAISVAEGDEYIRRTDTSVPASGDWQDHSGSADLSNPMVSCGESSYITGIQLAGGPNLFGEGLRYICRSLDGKTVEIKKTDPRISDTGLGGSEPPDGPVAGCPTGSFVSGIQGFKLDRDGDLGIIQLLRYGCRAVDSGQIVFEGKSDPNIGYSGFSGWWTGTAYYENDVARCPDGSFVTAIQTFTLLEGGNYFPMFRCDTYADQPLKREGVDSDVRCNPVDSIGSSTESRVSHSERRLLLGFEGTK
jgi:hypothetical protein